MAAFHQMVWPWAARALSAGMLPFLEGRSLMLAPPDDPNMGSRPIRLPVGAAATTGNVCAMSAESVLARGYYAGDSIQFRDGKELTLAWFAAEAKAHWGNEQGCPMPHSKFYYAAMVGIRMVAVATGDVELLTASGVHWGAHVALLRGCMGSDGTVWMPGFRAKGDPDHSLSTSILRAILRIQAPHIPSDSDLTVQALRHLLATGDDLGGSSIGETMPPLLCSLRRSIAGSQRLIELDPAAVAAAPYVAYQGGPETVCLWTLYDDATGQHSFGRPGTRAPALNAPAVDFLGVSSWNSAPTPAPAIPPVSIVPPAPDYAALSMRIKELQVAHKNVSLRDAVAVQVGAGKLTTSGRSILVTNMGILGHAPEFQEIANLIAALPVVDGPAGSAA